MPVRPSVAACACFARAPWAIMLAASFVLHCGGPEVYQVESNPPLLAENVTSIVATGLRTEQSTLNASFIDFRGHKYMAFRLDGPQGARRQQQLAFVAIDDDYQPRGKHRILHAPTRSGDISSAEDPRLFSHDEQLYMVYNARPVFAESNAAALDQRRLFLARIDVDETSGPPAGRLAWSRQLDIEPESTPVTLRNWEKNWTPFSHANEIHFIYRANAPLVFRLPAESLAQVELQARGAASESAAAAAPLVLQGLAPPAHETLPEVAGIWRGGTPAVYEPELGEYITFFHTRTHADYGTGFGARRYYMLGVYTFAAAPPFAIRRYLPEPLQIRERAQLPPGWTRIVFPSGIISNGNDYTVSFGRDDHAISIASINKRRLFAALARTGFANVTQASPDGAPVGDPNGSGVHGPADALSARSLTDMVPRR